MHKNVIPTPLILLASWLFLLLSPESSLLASKRTGQEKAEVISVACSINFLTKLQKCINNLLAFFSSFFQPGGKP
jgi:hypothetical protein